MITPQEKAAQLVVDNQLKVKSLDYKEAVQCAIVTVDEILKIAEPSTEQIQYTNGEWAREYREIPNRYWTEVKQILEKL